MKCEICNTEFRTINHHVLHIHNIQLKDYYDNFLKKENNGLCLVCGKPTKFKDLIRGYSKYCSNICTQKDPLTLQKVKDSCLKKYGVTNAMKLKMTKDKLKKTCLEKYGVDNPSQSIVIKDKKSCTCRKNFGVDNPGQSEEVKNKSKITCLERYGVDNVFKSKKVKDQIKDTLMSKYGVHHPYESKEIQERGKLTCLEKYGVVFWARTDEARQLFREKLIEQIEIQKLNGEPLRPMIGNLERECLNFLEKKFNIEIIRNNRIIGYFPDGYIINLNLVIEFDEYHHIWEVNKKRDIRKDQDLIKFLNCRIFRISKFDWLNNKETVIENFKNLLPVEVHNGI